MTALAIRSGLAIRRMQGALSWTLGAWLCCVASVASAQVEPGVRAEASLHFRQGVALFHEGAYPAARVELERAYAVLPDYRVLYNIGQTDSELGDYVAAVQAFERYLDKGGPHIDEARRRDVEADLAVLRTRIASLSISVDEAGATILVDGEDVGTSPLRTTLQVSAGRHRVEALGEHGRRSQQMVDVVGQDFRELSLRLAPALPRSAHAAVPAQVPPSVQTPTQELTRRDRVGLGLLAAGGALGIAAGVVGLGYTLDARERLDDARARHEDDDTQRAELRRFSTATNSLALGAAAFGITGALLLMMDGRARLPGRERHALAVNVSPRGVAVQGGF